MDYIKQQNQLDEYYANTLIVQYNGKPKAQATIEMLSYLMFANMTSLQIENGFDWKTAVGEQLNIIGQWVGVSRSYNIPSMAGKKLLAYPESSKLIPKDITTNNQHGYSTYATYGDNDGGMLRYDDLKGLDSKLSDADFRVLIGLKIIYNSIEHTVGAIDTAIWEYFEHKVYTTWNFADNPPSHVLEYHYPAELEDVITVALYKNILPAPIGVEVLIDKY